MSSLLGCVTPQQQAVQHAAVQAGYRDALIAGIRGDVSAQEREQLVDLLDRLEADPHGKILLDSMQAYRERFDKVPEIALRRDYQFPRPSLANPASGQTVWHLDLRELSVCTAFEAVRELAAVYCNIAGMPDMRDDVFAAYTFDPQQKLDPALEKGWEKWITAGDRALRDKSIIGRDRCIRARRSVIEHLRADLKQTRCYGRLTHGDFQRLIKNLGRGSDFELPTAPSTINLCAANFAGGPTGRSLHFSALPNVMVHIGPYQHKGHVRPGCESALPPLPADLEALCLDAYPRPDLSGLPSGLKVLRIRNAGLTEMPRPLPAALKMLDVAENSITRLDRPLPKDMETLIVSNNPLEDLPEILPRGLRHLEADETELRRLRALPASAVYVSVRNNALTALPALQEGMRHLNASGNQLTEIPQELPLSLECIQLTNNRLTRLPSAIANLAGCSIFLDGNPIARQHIPRPPDGVPGPRIFHSMQAGTPAPQGGERLPQLQLTNDPLTRWHSTVDNVAGFNFLLMGAEHIPHDGQHLSQQPRDLTEATSAWLSPDAPHVAQRWQTLGNPAEAGDFLLFLNRLRSPFHNNAKPFKTEAFRADVVALLTELSLPERAALRADVFALCTGATETCDDRVLWTLNQLKALLLNDDIRMGRYDDRIHEVVQAGREMFTLEMLDKIAREKVKTLTRIDEVEVYLAYAVKLRETLHLNSVVPGMLFSNSSGVTQADLDAALHTVRSRQLAEFPMFLALDYAPWQSLLRRREPDRHGADQAALHDEMERNLESELRTHLLSLGVDPHDQDARRVVGLSISRDIRYRVLGPLTAEYLGRYGSAD
jgi:hypothetical protein